MTYDERQLMMKDDNEDDLKNKEDLNIGGRHTALDIFRFAAFFFLSLLNRPSNKLCSYLQIIQKHIYSENYDPKVTV